MQTNSPLASQPTVNRQTADAQTTTVGPDACAPEARSSIRAADVADMLERTIVVVLFGWLVARLLTAFWADGQAVRLLLLPSEGLVVLFMLIRRRTRDVSRSWTDWLLAATATSVPLLVAAGARGSLTPPLLGALMMLIGILVQLHAKITLGRSFGLVAAHRGLKVHGPYRLVRHPMYAGYLITHLGFLALYPTLWNLAIYVVCYSLQIPRLLAEERLLSRDPKYGRYLEQVRYRLLPGIF